MTDTDDIPGDPPKHPPEKRAGKRGRAPRGGEPLFSGAAQAVDFDGGDGMPWRVELFGDLSAAFTLVRGELPKWHKMLAGQGRPWEIASRLYGVSCVVASAAPPPNGGKPMAKRAICAELGISEKSFDEELSLAVKFWEGSRKQARMEERAGVAPEASAAEGKRFRIYEPPPKPLVDEILRELRLDYLEDEAMRERIATRALQFETQLLDPTTTQAAQQLLRMEVDMERVSDLIRRLENKLEGVTDADKMADLAKEIRNQRGELDSLTTKHTATLGFVGASEAEVMKEKRGLIAQFGYAIKKMQEFYGVRGGENKLVDGVFSEQELRWLLTPRKMREPRNPQYRADVVIMVNECLQPENLWDPEFAEKPFNRDVARALRRIAMEGIAACEDDPVHPALPADVDLDDPEDEEGDEEIDTMMDYLDGEAASPSTAARSDAATPAAAMYARGGGGGDEIGYDEG